MNDVRKMDCEIKGLTEAMDRLIANKETRQNDLLASEQALVNCKNECKAVIDTYNSGLFNLATEYPDFKARLATLKASLNEEALESSNQVEIIGVDLVENEQVVSSSKVEMVDKNGTLRMDHQNALDKLESSKQSKNEASAKKRIVEDKVLVCEDTLRQDRQSHEAKLAVRRREADAMESKMAGRWNPVALEEQMATCERQVRELEDLQAQHQAENVSKKEAVLNEITETLQLVSDHEEYFLQKQKEVEQYIQAQNGQAPTITVPSNIPK
jgi:hypothetical protein